MIRYIFLLLLAAFAIALPAQETAYQYLLKLETTKESLDLRMSSLEARLPQGFQLIRALRTRAPLILVEDMNKYPEDQALDRLRKLAHIQHVEVVRDVQSRYTPNDPLLEEQWNITQIEAEVFWDKTTGGKTADGHEIVLAIFDTGFKMSHPDLSANRYINASETPDDGIDNDQNGYTDDYYGYELVQENDNHRFSDPHGTNVYSVAGASGDNNTGMAGVGYDLKYLLLSPRSNTTIIYEGFQYAIDMRQLFNETNGAKGAYIVAINCSFGIDSAFPNDHPQWCNMIDEMGQVGIITVSATSNTTANIDTFGDIPTTCPSAYQIAVTNTNYSDNIVSGAGRSATQVDLGAPGVDILAANTQDDYSSLLGTSVATPQVSAAVGLTYSYPCEKIQALIKEDPAEAALTIKALILSSTKPVSSLAGNTLTGGVLNLATLKNNLENYCTGLTVSKLSIEAIYATTASAAQLQFTYDDLSAEHYFKLYNEAGQLLLTESFVPEQTLTETYDLSTIDLPPGIYFASISTSKSHSASTKVQVR